MVLNTYMVHACFLRKRCKVGVKEVSFPLLMFS